MSHILFVFFIQLILIFSANASPIPHLVEIKTLQTPHFDIVYYAKQQDLAHHYARQLERAHTYLSPFFITRPKDRILVVLNDSTDLANGFATRVPYAYTMLFPVLPDLNDSLSEPTEWSLELATHELAHILSFEPASGVIQGLRSVFGTVVAPNLMLPNWWKEGLSVWTETAISQGGRLRSVYQNAAVRSWIGEKNLSDETVAMANETLPTWPWGSRPYLFGSLAMSYLVNTHGEEKSTELIELHGARVPYFLSGATQKVVNKNYEDIYQESLHFWEDRAEKQIEQLNKIEFDTPVEIQTGDLLIRSPIVSSNGKHLVWVGQNEQPLNHLKIAELNDRGDLLKIEIAMKLRVLREARFFPKSEKILVNAVMPTGANEQYSDFYVYDILKKRSERITKKLRGREGRVSPDETTVAFVGLEGGRTHLRILDLKTKGVQTLLSSEFDERIATPIYLNDSTLLFSWLKSGKETLWTYDLKSQKMTALPQWGNRMRRPHWNGKRLSFLSDKNGTFNLYESELNNIGSPVALTHTKTTLIDFDRFSDGSPIATVLTRQGPRLFHFEQLKNKKSLPEISNQDVKFGRGPAAPFEATQTTTFKEAPRPYKLWPHYWIPFYSGSSAKDGALVSITTSGHDPSLQHSYDLQALYDTGTQDFSYGVNYTNRTQKIPWVLQSNRIVRSFAGSEENYSNQVHAVSAAPDTSSWTDQFSSQFSLLYAKYEDDFRSYERYGPQLGFSYNTAEQTLWMVSPESGSTVQLVGTHFLESSDLESYNQVRLRGATYWSRWLPQRHALALDVKALSTDRRVPSILGDASTYFINELTSNFLIRGYYEGQFIGRNLVNANLEYRFPLTEGHPGWGLFPLYVRRLHGAFAFDALALDGFAYREQTRSDVAVDRSQVFSSVGAELRIDTTVGYLLPLQAVVGFHKPLQKEYREPLNTVVQIRTSLSF